MGDVLSWIVLFVVVVLAFFVARFIFKLARGMIAFLLMAIIVIGIVVIVLCIYCEAVEIVSITPLYPPILGDFLKLGDTPRPPAGSILHLFFYGL